MVKEEAGASVNVLQETPSMRNLEDLITGKHSLPLWIVRPIINDKLSCECILDPGAQIVVMRKDVWIALGHPRDSKVFILMESANNSKNQTLGLLKDVKFTFGPVSLYLQVQVVDSTLFEVLLGCPFFSLLNSLLEDTPDGEVQITLTNPNTGKSVTIPTMERVISRKIPEEREHLGKKDF
ncbi:hypothetical protein JAAARDRAFT_49857 [Jaapia argillacea MUCL 33604]|uniref:Aspartic peptidase DDI1-type domain-containing protein n=1 Tax=Jaapia argillacea MUCL 33604 TaxID=933084 RepID=A0A067PET0_9AGAM|nr:hypothetical protein JAAARDRAFT_49857 [Jaapia argillacea MUCL 33604]